MAQSLVRKVMQPSGVLSSVSFDTYGHHHQLNGQPRHSPPLDQLRQSFSPSCQHITFLYQDLSPFSNQVQPRQNPDSGNRRWRHPSESNDQHFAIQIPDGPTRRGPNGQPPRGALPTIGQVAQHHFPLCPGSNLLSKPLRLRHR